LSVNNFLHRQKCQTWNGSPLGIVLNLEFKFQVLHRSNLSCLNRSSSPANSRSTEHPAPTGDASEILGVAINVGEPFPFLYYVSLLPSVLLSQPTGATEERLPLRGSPCCASVELIVSHRVLGKMVKCVTGHEHKHVLQSRTPPVPPPG
jgi:hypothetical protein